MKELLVILIVIAVIAVIVYLRRESAKAAEQKKVDEFRRLQTRVEEEDRAATATAAAAGGMLQQAADRAAGSEYAKATDAMAAQTEELAKARTDADRAAARLANRADQALASIEAAAAAHGGAVPGDGTRDCPPDYPIKGNMPSNTYHLPGQLSYHRTIPEVCFQSVAAAEAAGFAAAMPRPAK